MLIAEGNGLRVHAIDAGSLKVDGGAMFGSVPKPLWSKQVEPDEQNRIRLALRCLLVESSDERILVDAGLGCVEAEELRVLFGIEDDSGEVLQRSLEACGTAPEEITSVVCTHLHFDHAGGLVRTVQGQAEPTFPNATHLVRAGEWAFTRSDHPYVRESYDRGSLDAWAEAARIEFIDHDEDVDVGQGVRAVLMPGHTPHHQGVLVDLGGDILCYPCDLVPTVGHTRLTWVMAFDIDPMRTVTEKERWLTRAGEEGWTLVFSHDHEVAHAKAAPDPSGVGCRLEQLGAATSERVAEA